MHVVSIDSIDSISIFCQHFNSEARMWLRHDVCPAVG